MIDGKLYALKDLFKARLDYKSKLNTIIRGKIADDNISLLREFEGISDKQEYYLTERSLLYTINYMIIPLTHMAFWSSIFLIRL